MDPDCTSKMEHTVVYCKKCSKTIKGHRYKCVECDDFDLCASCRSDYHSGHVLIRLTCEMTHFDRVFLNQIAKQTPDRESFLIQGPHEETCHSCGRSPVQGFLYKCCDCGYNGCHRCQSINGKCIVTGNNHLLFRFADPLNLNNFNKRLWHEILDIRSTGSNQVAHSDWITKLPARTVKHDGIKCNVCHDDVIGCRFKCIDCKDYDLCSSCEPKNAHLGHSMVRIGKLLDSRNKKILEVIVRSRISTYQIGVTARMSNCNSWNVKSNCHVCEKTIGNFLYKCVECGVDMCLRCQIKEWIHDGHFVVRLNWSFKQNPMNQSFYEAITKITAGISQRRRKTVQKEPSTCPTDFLMTANQTNCRSVKTQSDTCPTGFPMPANQSNCRSVKTQSDTCPTGFPMPANQSNCRSVRTQSDTCPTGFPMPANQSNCRSVRTQSDTCPTGFPMPAIQSNYNTGPMENSTYPTGFPMPANQSNYKTGPIEPSKCPTGFPMPANQSNYKTGPMEPSTYPTGFPMPANQSNYKTGPMEPSTYPTNFPMPTNQSNCRSVRTQSRTCLTGFPMPANQSNYKTGPIEPSKCPTGFPMPANQSNYKTGPMEPSTYPTGFPMPANQSNFKSVPTEPRTYSTNFPMAANQSNCGSVRTQSDTCPTGFPMPANQSNCRSVRTQSDTCPTGFPMPANQSNCRSLPNEHSTYPTNFSMPTKQSNCRSLPTEPSTYPTNFPMPANQSNCKSKTNFNMPDAWPILEDEILNEALTKLSAYPTLNEAITKLAICPPMSEGQSICNAVTELASLMSETQSLNEPITELTTSMSETQDLYNAIAEFTASSKVSSNLALNEIVNDYSMPSNCTMSPEGTLYKAMTDLTINPPMSELETLKQAATEPKTSTGSFESTEHILYEEKRVAEVSDGSPMQELSRTMSRMNVMGKKGGNSKGKKRFTSFVDTIQKNDRIAKENKISNCILCYEQPSEIMLLNCNHLCICSKCFDAYKKNSRQCPVCKFPIEAIRRVFH